MHIGMRLLHPAATDHSVSISRQQVQHIFSFSLCWQVNSMSWTRSSDDSRAGGMAPQRWWFFPCRVDYTQVALPPACVAGSHLPCALLVKTSWVLLQTTCHPCISGSFWIISGWFMDRYGRYLAPGDGYDRCLTCLGSKHAEVAFVDESYSDCGKMIISELRARLCYLDKGAELCCLCLDLVLVLTADSRGLL